ncbi:hypothetical protein F5Y08DRAFT_142173 [Xylaria arbuscula]|nr:hypothetical protein F5Y08DRAFT_142173 [Xylaria arbuscula]
MAASESGEKPTKGPLPVYLIPWDPDSQEHVDRMKLQRIACGWKVQQVDSWRETQRTGQAGLHWVVLHPDHPESLSRLESHIAAYPAEASALSDTCKAVFGRPHKPDPLVSQFHPVGHIGLDAVTHEPELETSLANGILSLMNFYISRALQGRGLGGAAMAFCEQMAREEFGARAITLETVANSEVQPDSPRRIAMKRPPLTITPEDWYTRHGYRVYSRRKVAWVDVDETGKEWPVGSSILRKDLG